MDSFKRPKVGKTDRLHEADGPLVADHVGDELSAAPIGHTAFSRAAPLSIWVPIAQMDAGPVR